ncbi:MAG TPA: hypothetical protein PLP29_10680 [Candidatus Ozemobacteraceae bacterium]|nr:hypothetical protein [Candidatus Ozemobacteraceae bacterium]
MQTLTEALWNLHPPGGLFDESVISTCFPTATAAGRRNLLYRATQAGEVISLRRGLYVLTSPACRTPIDPLALPPLVYGPSYVSFETALRFHGLIPELVHTIAAATSRRSRTFDTPMGRFEFRSVPTRMLMAGVRLEAFEHDGGPVLAPVASPARAIADLLYTRKDVSKRTDIEKFLSQSWRIELDELAAATTPEEMGEVLATYRNTRVRQFLDGLSRLLAHFPQHTNSPPKEQNRCT